MNIPDRHLEAALEFAVAHSPCMLVVDTLAALRVAKTVLAVHGTVYIISGEVSRDLMIEAINRWNAFPENSGVGEPKLFLVITKALVGGGGFQLTRRGHIATSGIVSEFMERRIRGRFFRVTDQPTEHLIHAAPRQCDLPLQPRN